MPNIVIDANTWIRFARNRNIAPLVKRISAYGLVPIANNYLLSEVFDAQIIKIGCLKK